MNKSKIEKRLPEPQLKKEQKADVTSVSPAIAKPTVICSQSEIDRPSNILFSIGDLNFYKGNGDSCPIIKILKTRALKLRPQ